MIVPPKSIEDYTLADCHNFSLGIKHFNFITNNAEFAVADFQFSKKYKIYLELTKKMI